MSRPLPRPLPPDGLVPGWTSASQRIHDAQVQRQHLSRAYADDVMALVSSFHAQLWNVFAAYEQKVAPLCAAQSRAVDELHAQLVGAYVSIACDDLASGGGAERLSSRVATAVQATSSSTSTTTSAAAIDEDTSRLPSTRLSALLDSHLALYARRPLEFAASPDSWLTTPTDPSTVSSTSSSSSPYTAYTDMTASAASASSTPLPPPSSNLVVLDVRHSLSSPLAVALGEQLQRVHDDHSSWLRETERRKLDRVQQSALSAQARERRVQLVTTSLQPLFPLLSVEDGMSALERHRDNLDACIDEMVAWSENDWIERLDAGAAAAPSSSAAVPSSSAVAAPSSSAAARSSSPDRPCITYRIVSVSRPTVQPAPATSTPLSCDASPDAFLDADLHVVPVLDRNRIPLAAATAAVSHYRSSSHTTTFRLSSVRHSFPSFRVLDEVEARAVEEALTTRIPSIIYQCLEGGDVSPIHVSPPLPLDEYAMHLDRHSQRIERVQHRLDGDIEFCAIQDTGTNPLLRLAPLQLFTQVLDADTFHVLHMHVHDMSESIAVDTVMLPSGGIDSGVVESSSTALTGKSQRNGSISMQAREDLYRFTSDASGRALTYRIVVQDHRIRFVLSAVDEAANVVDRQRASQPQQQEQPQSQQPRRVCEAPFCEVPIPRLGDYVLLPDDSLAVVTRVPLGLLIASASSSFLSRQVAAADGASASARAGASTAQTRATVESLSTPSFAPRWSCLHQHPDEMAGLIDVRVVMVASAEASADATASPSTSSPQSSNQPNECSVPVCRLLPAPPARVAHFAQMQTQRAEAARARLVALLEELEAGLTELMPSMLGTRSTAAAATSTSSVPVDVVAQLARLSQLRVELSLEPIAALDGGDDDDNDGDNHSAHHLSSRAFTARLERANQQLLRLHRVAAYRRP